MKWLVYSLIALYSFGYFKKMSEVELKHFSQTEFGAWWPLMNRDLLLKLDAFREAWQNPVIISPAFGSLGRTLGPGDSSQHNVTRWGEVRAADIMPLIEEPDGTRRGMNRGELWLAYTTALRVGFHGIGVYPGWQPYTGLHVDMREDRSGTSPALWSRINGEYVGVDQAWV